MNLLNILLASFLCILPLSEGERTSKLQIGVKRRVDDCRRRTKKGDTLHIHYIGSLQESGVEFDRSRKEEPFVFTIGSSQVIKGWEQGVLGMCEGEKRKVVVPPELGYGDTGAPPDIPPNAVLVFELDLVKIDHRHEL